MTTVSNYISIKRLIYFPGCYKTPKITRSPGGQLATSTQQPLTTSQRPEARSQQPPTSSQQSPTSSQYPPTSAAAARTWKGNGVMKCSPSSVQECTAAADTQLSAAIRWPASVACGGCSLSTCAAALEVYSHLGNVNEYGHKRRTH